MTMMYQDWPLVGTKPPPMALAAGWRCLFPQSGGYTTIELIHAQDLLRLSAGICLRLEKARGRKSATTVMIILDESVSLWAYCVVVEIPTCK